MRPASNYGPAMSDGLMGEAVKGCEVNHEGRGKRINSSFSFFSFPPPLLFRGFEDEMMSERGNNYVGKCLVEGRYPFAFLRCKIINSTGGEGAIIGLELNGDAKRVIKFIGILTLQMSLINVV